MPLTLSATEIQTQRQSSSLWAVFLLCALVSIGFFFIPAFIIRPFRYQSPRGLLIAMSVHQCAPLVTLIADAACFVLALFLWKSATWLRRGALTIVLVLAIASAAMSRENYFEWMFHSIDAPRFLSQSEGKLAASEMVLAINLADDSRAYPISQMAYHHILNDDVGGIPIVVTY
jgi:hypothetical protein